MGGRKIDMQKPSNNDSQKASFSERCNDLFQTASEVCSLSGSEMAVVVYSSEGKPYVFVQPSGDSVLDRFLAEQSSRRLDDHNDDHEEEEGEVQDEDCMDVEKFKLWVDANRPREDAGLDELMKYKASLLGYMESTINERKRRESCAKDF